MYGSWSHRRAGVLGTLGTMTQVPTRRDAARNRDLLVGAARRTFTALGPDAPLEEIAHAAGVSRTTLHRHFASREELATAVMQQNVADIEARAVALADVDDGAVRLYHYLLDVQLEAPWLSRVVAHSDRAGVGDLARRTAEALAPLVEQARAAGVLHPGVTTDDLLMTLPMAMAIQIVDPHTERAPRSNQARTILHRGLFTTDPPG